MSLAASLAALVRTLARLRQQQQQEERERQARQEEEDEGSNSTNNALPRRPPKSSSSSCSLHLDSAPTPLWQIDDRDLPALPPTLLEEAVGEAHLRPHGWLAAVADAASSVAASALDLVQTERGRAIAAAAGVAVVGAGAGIAWAAVKAGRRRRWRRVWVAYGG